MQAQTQIEGPIHDQQMPFTSHLAELRSRLIKCVVALAAGFAVCFTVAEQIFAFLAEPLHDINVPGLTLVGTAVTEAFFTKMKVAFAGAVVLALPVLLWQIWQFVAPGLYEHEKRYTRAFVFFGSIFFLAGAVFSTKVLIGQGLGFLLRRYAAINVQPWIQISEYFGIAVRLVLACGVMFQMPVLAFFFARVGLIDHRFLIRHFRYALVAMAILAAVLTPPDFVAQGLFMAPLAVLYGVSIGVAFLARRRNRATEDTENGE
jgi:sec-independent protein translocase protein TatC